MARKRRTNDEAPGWIWMLFGLGIGLVVALGVYINGRQTPTPQDATATVNERAPAEALPEEPQVGTAAAPVSSGSQRSRIEDPDRFSFYDELPRYEVVVPEIESPSARSNTATAIEAPGVYVLQAGSFRTAEDAEVQRANLALLGIESRIQRVSIDEQTFHRVRVGPIDDLDSLNAIRRRLFDANVESLVMRIAE